MVIYIIRISGKLDFDKLSNTNLRQHKLLQQVQRGYYSINQHYVDPHQFPCPFKLKFMFLNCI